MSVLSGEEAEEPIAQTEKKSLLGRPPKFCILTENHHTELTFMIFPLDQSMSSACMQAPATNQLSNWYIFWITYRRHKNKKELVTPFSGKFIF